MSMLTGHEIHKLAHNRDLRDIDNRNIVIEPFHGHQLNPNSYNLRLAPELIEFTKALDLKKDPVNAGTPILIPEEGFLLEPGVLYLGSTVEYTETENLIPCIEGRSSIARYGIEVHISAGFGDIGFKGCWTLEITCVVPVMIYPNIEICQISYHTPVGRVESIYQGKYQRSRGPGASLLHREF